MKLSNIWQLFHRIYISVERQVASIFCGSNGYLDDLDPHDLARFESEFLVYMDQNYNDVLEEIAETGDLSDELVERLHTAAKNFENIFDTTESDA